MWLPFQYFSSDAENESFWWQKSFDYIFAMPILPAMESAGVDVFFSLLLYFVD